MRPDERAVLERAIERVTEQAAKANALVDESMAAGLHGFDRIVVGVKMLRAEVLSIKTDLERELEAIVLDCVVRTDRSLHRPPRRAGWSLGAR